MTDPSDALPDLRASDAEREQAADVLRTAASEGRVERAGDEVTPAGGPIIRLRLVSILGGTGVLRGRKPRKGERGHTGSNSSAVTTGRDSGAG